MIHYIFDIFSSQATAVATSANGGRGSGWRCFRLHQMCITHRTFCDGRWLWRVKLLSTRMALTFTFMIKFQCIYDKISAHIHFDFTSTLLWPIWINRSEFASKRKNAERKKTNEIFNQTTHLIEFSILLILNISIKNLLALCSIFIEGIFLDTMNYFQFSLHFLSFFHIFPILLFFPIYSCQFSFLHFFIFLFIDLQLFVVENKNILIINWYPKSYSSMLQSLFNKFSFSFYKTNSVRY